MYQEKPDFYLSAAGEMRGDLGVPRACRKNGRLKDKIRDDHMWVYVDPPINGQEYGRGGNNIIDLILSARFNGTTLFPIRQWPCDVYISRILDQSITKTQEFTAEQVQLIGWGRIFPSLESAKEETANFGL